MQKYYKYIRPYKQYFILGPLCMALEIGGEVSLPFLMSKMINTGAAEGNIAYIAAMGAIMITVSLVMLLGGLGGAYFAVKAAANFSCDLRKDLFCRVQSFSFENIDDYSAGSLITRLTNDVTQVQNIIVMLLRGFLRSPGIIIGASILAFSINSELACVFVVAVPVLAVSVGLILSKAFPRFRLMQNRLDELNNSIQEDLTGVRVVKSFVREDYEQKRFYVRSSTLKGSTLGAFRLAILGMPVMMMVMCLTTVSIVWFGGRMVMEGTLKVGDLMAFITYVNQILISLMMLSMIILNSSRAFASLDRIGEILSTKVTLDDAGARFPDRKVSEGSVEFEHVTFSYNKHSDKPVLSDISFRIEAGETFGIIGSTGSGKSTLVALMARLYDTDSGTVRVDGVDVKDYSLSNLREGVGMVLQKNVLFSGSIKDNLRWGDAGASDEELAAAASAAMADGFVRNMPEGYDTQLNQGGVNLSGGQKQRLCIARALLKKPAILVLDDSTSAVDTATEAMIRKHFAEEIKNTTKIIIAQRISSIRDADHILVLDDGQIAGLGSHESLLRECEAYQEICQMGEEPGPVSDSATACPRHGSVTDPSVQNDGREDA